LIHLLSGLDLVPPDSSPGGEQQKTGSSGEEPVEGSQGRDMAIPCWCSDRTPSDGRASSRTRRANRTPTRRFGRSRRIAVAAFSSESSWLHGRPARRAAQEREEYPPVSSGPDFVV